MAAIYNLTLIVGRTVLPDLQESYRALWISLDYVSDLVYIIDVFVRFRTSEYVKLQPLIPYLPCHCRAPWELCRKLWYIVTVEHKECLFCV